MSEKPLVAVMMGSDSDYEAMIPCLTTLEEFGVPYALSAYSAHRAPDQAAEFLSDWRIGVIIAAASMAAALPGFAASKVRRPVIGVALEAPPFNGIDSLLSMLQMPPDVPVATVTVGKHGPRNAALLAIQILAVGDKDLDMKLGEWYNARRTKAVGKHDSVLRLDERRHNPPATEG